MNVEQAWLTGQVLAWRADANLYVRQCLGATPDKWQTRALVLVSKPETRRLAFKACKGPGKTAVLAWIILWFLTCHFESKVGCTSITEANIDTNLWPELMSSEPYVPIWQRTPSLNDRSTERYAISKHAIPTRLAEKTAADRDEKRDERAGRKAAVKRDGKICRCCKRVVVPQLELAANRLEVHHVAGRADQVVRWDVRNLLVLCQKCHSKITERRLWILQAARFLFKADNAKTTYINASKKVTFSEKPA